MKSTKSVFSVALLALLVALLTACGGTRPKGELPPPADPPAPAPVAKPTPPPPPPPPPAPEPEPPRFTLEGVNFDTDRATLKQGARDILDNAATVIPKFQEYQFRVGGHTDSQGSDSYNIGLSERRVASVIDYLVSKGVSRDQLVGVGYGEALPIDTNDTPAGRARNRRVEIVPIY
ncbi:MAG: OmpA family protein [Pseudomonadota bacterium]